MKKNKTHAPRAKRTEGSQRRAVRALRRALREIVWRMEPHMDEREDIVEQDPECFCPRCIAVRALRPNDPSSPSADHE